MAIPPDITRLLTHVQECTGLELFFVGGCVRDELLGRTPSDIDLLVRGHSHEEVKEKLSRHFDLFETGTRFTVFQAKSKQSPHHEFEIAVPRLEKSLGLGTQDWAVMCHPTLTVEEDLARRDFCFNAIARPVNSDQIIDPHRGAIDIFTGQIREVYSNTFVDDPMRILRALRFKAQLGFDLDPATAQSIRNAIPELEQFVPRFQSAMKKEMSKILTGPFASGAFRMMIELGLAPVLFPELEHMDVCTQNQWHDHDVLTHSLKVLEGVDRKNVLLRAAALFHDSGKPATRWVSKEGGVHFYEPDPEKVLVAPFVAADHADVGAEIAERQMIEWGFSNEDANRVKALVALHMFPQGPKLSSKAARKLLQRILHFTEDLEGMVDDLFNLRIADLWGGKPETAESDIKNNEKFLAKVLHALEDEDAALTTHDLNISGHTLMALGLQGKEIGDMQVVLLDAVLDDPVKNNPETLLALAKAQLGLL